jgi:hypothetical protein
MFAKKIPRKRLTVNPDTRKREPIDGPVSEGFKDERNSDEWINTVEAI